MRIYIVHTYVHVYTFIYMYIYVYTCTCTCNLHLSSTVHTYIHVYVYTYMYIPVSIIYVRSTCYLYVHCIVCNNLSTSTCICTCTYVTLSHQVHAESLEWLKEAITSFGFLISIKPHIDYIKKAFGATNPAGQPHIALPNEWNLSFLYYSTCINLNLN